MTQISVDLPLFLLLALGWPVLAAYGFWFARRIGVQDGRAQMLIAVAEAEIAASKEAAE